MRIWILSIMLVVFSTTCFAGSKALILSIDGIIGPATQDYIKQGIAYGTKTDAALIILEINTPGGLQESTHSINNAILRSPIPIVSYVSPAGARAASAGTYILYASPIAAMAPGTHLGAATPVTYGNVSSEKQRKMTNDSLAYLKSLAALRKRNVEWAELAVKQSASITAEEAKRLNVISIIAEGLPQLLQAVDGQKVTLNGKETTITANSLVIEKMPPGWRYDFLSFITQPNITYIFILIAIYGLFFELSNPGLVLPGVAGLISLLIVLYAFQLMPVNYTGLTLLLLGITFMIIEVYVSSFGVIGLGGIIAFIIGSIMLFDMTQADFRLALPLIFTMSVLSLLFFYILLNLAIKSHKRAIATGREGLIGSQGTVLNVEKNKIFVRVLGEIWEAKATQDVKSGQRIRVVDVSGLTLFVEPTQTTKKL